MLVPFNAKKGSTTLRKSNMGVGQYSLPPNGLGNFPHLVGHIILLVLSQWSSHVSQTLINPHIKQKNLGSPCSRKKTCLESPSPLKYRSTTVSFTPGQPTPATRGPFLSVWVTGPALPQDHSRSKRSRRACGDSVARWRGCIFSSSELRTCTSSPWICADWGCAPGHNRELLLGTA